MVSINRFRDYLINENNENSILHINNKLDEIEAKLEKLFDTKDEGQIKKFGETDEESNIFKNLEFGSLERAKFAKTYKSLKLIFFDENFRYDVTFKINLKDAVTPEGQEFDPETLKDCYVEFVRYTRDENTKEGEILDKKVSIEDINEDLFNELLIELDKKYPVSSGMESGASSEGEGEEEFKIETE